LKKDLLKGIIKVLTGPLRPKKEKKMKNNEIKDLTLASVFAAIILVMIFVPQVGFITLGAVSLTLIHIPVLVGVFLLPTKHSLILGFIFGLGSLIKAAVQPVGPLDPLFVMPWVSVLPRLLFTLAAIYIFKGLKAFDGFFKHSDLIIFITVSLITFIGVYYAFVAIGNQTNMSSTLLTIISFFISGIFIISYFIFIKSKDNKQNALIPSIMILSTVAHTILVLFALVIFEGKAVQALFPDANLYALILTVAVTNGLIEAFLAAIIGTPIIIALQQVKERA
jgi:uncharacterized membrane protein